MKKEKPHAKAGLDFKKTKQIKPKQKCDFFSLSHIYLHNTFYLTFFQRRTREIFFVN